MPWKKEKKGANSQGKEGANAQESKGLPMLGIIQDPACRMRITGATYEERRMRSDIRGAT